MRLLVALGLCMCVYCQLMSFWGIVLIGYQFTAHELPLIVSLSLWLASMELAVVWAYIEAKPVVERGIRRDWIRVGLL